MTTPPRPLPRLSPKRAAANHAAGIVAFSTIAKRGGKPKAKKRTPGEFARIYGSKARVAWIANHCCIACGERGCENAHVMTGGMGRKADAEFIVPLCKGCHQLLHVIGAVSFASRFNLHLRNCAAAIQRAWQATQPHED